MPVHRKSGTISRCTLSKVSSEAAAQEQEQEQEELASVASPEEAVKEQEAEETGSDVDTEELEDLLRDYRLSPHKLQNTKKKHPVYHHSLNHQQ